MRNGGESFQCHACFVTTTSVAEPTVKFQTRCAITRTVAGHLAAAGVYYLTSTEDIGDDVFADHCDYDVNLSTGTGGVTPGAVINVAKIAAFIWQIQLFRCADATPVLVLDDMLVNAVGAIVNVTLKRVDPA